MSMSEAHRALLRKNRVMLVKDLEVNDALFAVLIAEDLFSESNCQDIMSRSTRSAQAAAFLDAVPRKGEDAWPALLKGLIHSKQSVIAKILDPSLTQQIKASLDSQSSPCVPIVTQDTQPSGGANAFSQLEETAFMDNLIRAMKTVSVMDSNCLSRVKIDEVYDLRRKPRGRALIINNSNFKPPMLSRAGASFDGTNLCMLFEALYFQTELKENLTALQMKTLLLEERSKSEHSAADAFILCILSHGANGVVYGVDGGKVEVDRHIVQMFNASVCPSLANKPKVIIIQACQGEGETAGTIQSDAPETEEEKKQMEELTAAVENLKVGDTQDSIPELRATHELQDMLIAYATCPGYKSFRQTELGSWFIRALIRETCEHGAEEHLEDILTRVRRAVLEQKTNVLWFDKPHYIQLTETRNRLLKPLFFFPGYAESKC